MARKSTTTEQKAPQGRPIYVGTMRVGHVIDTTFHKSVRSSSHMLKRPKGWAVDVKSLDEAVKYGATSVKLWDQDTHTYYHASIDTIKRHGFIMDRGYGEQWVLPLEHWGVNDQPSEYERKRQEALAKQKTLHTQLSMFPN